ncbi:RDD family protein [Fibrella sp. HMF5335]|uniref:RDD family protein n=1 Tax=Fibrella rubiginis TaxID=2817060 RepID=A0A939GM00_9BACT|nr:RDD family protein [Fibrella rubiginis]MBO0938882.1 RDD family protein [Fibrella rubiginis]
MEISSTRNLLDPSELIEIEHIPASRGKRLATYLLDFVIWLFSLFVLVFIWAMFIEVTENDTLLNVIVYGSFVFYTTLFEWLLGQTPGKMITGTLVINEQGQPISFWQALGRSFARLIPFDALTYISRERPRGLHDKVSGTWVVNKITPSVFQGKDSLIDSTSHTAD